MQNQITANDPTHHERLSKYGMKRLDYLKDHKPTIYRELVHMGELHSHCIEVQRAARNRFEFMMKQMLERNPVPEGLKNTDPLRWVRMMNNYKASIEEIIYSELVYE
jgi:hypothetical protein